MMVNSSSHTRRMFVVRVTIALSVAVSVGHGTLNKNANEVVYQTVRYVDSPECGKTALRQAQRLEAFDSFLKMSIDGVQKQRLERFKRVPALSGLDLFLWDTHPTPVYMLANNHLRWYTNDSNEQKLVRILRSVLESHTAPKEDIFVADMGINDGYIAALAAAYGYNVIAVDAQPECVRRFQFARAFNDWNNVQIYNSIVLDENKTLMVPRGVCGGGSRFQGSKTKILGLKQGVSTEGIYGETAVRSITLDELVPHGVVLFFHLDVEGAELSVLKSARNLLQERRIVHIVWEFAPHRWSAQKPTAIAEIKRCMRDFHCQDLRHISVTPKEGILVNTDAKERITDWDAFFTELEQKRVITDLWCHLPEATLSYGL